MPWLRFNKWRCRFPANGHDMRAACVKAAAGRRVHRIGRIARQRRFGAALRRVHGRARCQKGAGIGMRRAAINLINRAFFRHLPQIHHQHAVGHFRDYAQVMSDEQDGCTCLTLQIADQIEDLRLDSDIKRRGRFVGKQHAWAAGQRHGDHDALLHAPTELVRIIPSTSFGCGDAHALQQPSDFSRGGTSRGVKAEGFEHLGSDPQDRIERGAGFLEDVADDSASDGSEFGRRHRQNIPALQQNLATGIACGRSREEACDAQGGDAFAASAFAHEAEGLSLGDGE